MTSCAPPALSSVMDEINSNFQFLACLPRLFKIVWSVETWQNIPWLSWFSFDRFWLHSLEYHQKDTWSSDVATDVDNSHAPKTSIIYTQTDMLCSNFYPYIKSFQPHNYSCLTVNRVGQDFILTGCLHHIKLWRCLTGFIRTPNHYSVISLLRRMSNIYANYFYSLFRFSDIKTIGNWIMSRIPRI